MKLAPVQKIFVFLFGLAVFVLPMHAYAAAYQQCVAGQTCAVGEFLYDDSYVPVSNAACTIKSMYPDGNVFINTQAMTPASGGWYSYDIVATGSAGLYRSQVCCTTNGEYMCLDKSFEVTTASSSGGTSLSSTDVANAVWNAQRSSHTASGSFGEALQNIFPSTSDIATAVWGYSGRTLSSFGSLVSDIWSSSSRSLTSLGTLAADVWSSASRTLTGSGLADGSLATKSDVDSVRHDVSSIVATTSGNLALNNDKLTVIAKTTRENRLLLEQIVNKPIIQNFLEDDKTPDLGIKLEQTKILSTQLYIASNRIGGKLGVVAQKWKQMSSTDVLAALQEFGKYMGESNSPASETVLASVNSLKKQWDMVLLDDMQQQAEAFTMRVKSLQSEVRLYGKSSVAYDDFQQLRTYQKGIDSKLGMTDDTAKKDTFFGRIRHITELATSFGKQTAEIDKLLAGWTSYKQETITLKAQSLVEAIATTNTIPQVMASLQLDNVQTNKQLKNKVLGMRGVIDSNLKLLARSSEKPMTNMWLEEGSIVFKSLVTNPSALISQKVPLKYYLPLEVTKESIISVDDGLTVSYDAEKNQYFVSGEFELQAEESKTISVTVDEQVFTIPEAVVASLRHQADELTKPLKSTSYFAQGVTLKSDIDVSLDKITQLQKSPVTPEARIKAYREATIELSAVKNKMEKLKELVTQVSATGSLLGFVGGTQAVAVWGIIIIMIAGFVFLTVYMRMLRVPGKSKITADSEAMSPEEQIVGLSQKNKRVRSMRKIASFAIVILTVSTSLSVASGLGVYTIMKAAEQHSELSVSPERMSQEKLQEMVLGVQMTATESAGLHFMTKEASVSAVQQMVSAPLTLRKIVVKENPAGFLRVRKTPGGVELTRIALGLQLPLVQEEKGWSQVSLPDGSMGWVSTKLVEEVAIEK